MQNEIKCPNCGQIFKIDESNYDMIVKQIKDHTFDEEVKRKLDASLSLADAKKDKEIAKLKEDYVLKLNEKDKEILSLENKIQQADSLKDSEVLKAISNEKEKLNQKDVEIEKLKQTLILKESEQKTALIENTASKDKEIADLNYKIQCLNNEHLTEKEKLKNRYEIELDGVKEQLAFYKDFKAKQSTKAIGESLEQYCYDEFNKIRSVAFPNAYFEKDNVISKESGSKGDFIFKDFDNDGTEIVSIMFEMKNEVDTTATKHKNEHFFKELDKDRKEKKCEYAVLVSLLEQDSELYNAGIVNVSYKYPKMYVVRPNFFIPIISLIKEGALNSLSYKKELELARSQDVDLHNFEENINKFKEGFGRNYELAAKRFKTAVEEIDKSIDHLQKIKDALLSSENNLRLANDKAQDISVKKLTKNAPSVAKKINDAMLK